MVVDEIFHQYREELEEAYSTYQKGVRMLNRFGTKSVKNATDDDFVAKTCSEMEHQYMGRLKGLGIKILPYPKVAHTEVVRKELYGRKPFSSSQKGYRDSLIWETVKEQLMPVKDLLGETQIVNLTPL